MLTRTRDDDRRSIIERSLHEWEEAGIIGPDQAAAIEAFEHALEPSPVATPPTPRRIPVVAEALGYLGGMLGVIGLVLLLTRYWPDMATPARLGMALAGAAVLTLAGVLVPHRDEPALERLRWFMWLGATACSGLAGGVFVAEVVDTTEPSSIVSGATAAVAVHSAVLWRGQRRPVQQGTFLAAALGAICALTATAAGIAWGGLALWVAAAIVLGVGLVHLIDYTPLTVLIGALGMFIGSAMTIDGDRGTMLPLMLLTSLGLLGLAVTTWPARSLGDRIALGVVGAFATLQALPRTLAWFAADAAVVTGAVVLACGVLLLLAADRPWVRMPVTVQIAGGAAMVGGAAITAIESVALATSVGLGVAVLLLVLGTMPGRALMSVFGCAGLLVNVPWAISYWFPGEGRAPLLIAVSGVLIVLVAVWLSHRSGAMRTELRHRRRG